MCSATPSSTGVIKPSQTGRQNVRVAAAEPPTPSGAFHGRANPRSDAKPAASSRRLIDSIVVVVVVVVSCVRSPSAAVCERGVVRAARSLDQNGQSK